MKISEAENIELKKRLNEIESGDFIDPAHQDLSSCDISIIFLILISLLLVLGVVVGVYYE